MALRRLVSLGSARMLATWLSTVRSVTASRVVPSLLSRLRATPGIPHQIRRVGYEFQRGGDEMPVLDATS